MKVSSKVKRGDAAIKKSISMPEFMFLFCLREMKKRKLTQLSDYIQALIRDDMEKPNPSPNVLPANLKS